MPTYANVLAKNVRAARTRADLQQDQLAARMRSLGYTAWIRQTVANVEKGRRRLTVEEAYALSWALEITMASLIAPTDDDELVEFASGEAISALSAQRTIRGVVRDRAVWWDGDSAVVKNDSAIRTTEELERHLTPRPIGDGE